MTQEETLYKQIETRLIDYLKAAGLPYREPAQTVCPHCGQYAGILMDFIWNCPNCNRRGDVVDYVMALDHIDSSAEVVKRICRTLRIRLTELDVIRADELMDMQYENTGMLIEKMMGKGVYILAGAPKVGKSWLVLWLAHQVSRGEAVWEFKTRRCGVLYISLEDTRLRIQRRMAEVTGGETGNLWIATESELIGGGLEVQLENFLKTYEDVKFVIIDTLQKVRQMGADRFSYAGDYEVMSQIKTLADRFDITVLLVHHTRKAASADPFAMISGTTGISGGVDGSMVLLKSQRQDDVAELHVTGRDIQDMQIDLLFDRNDKTWHFVGYGTCEKAERQNQLLTTLLTLLQEIREFHGTASDLLQRLNGIKTLKVKTPNALTRQLNPHTSRLKNEYGILYECDRSGKERTLHLKLLLCDDNDGNDDNFTHR